MCATASFGTPIFPKGSYRLFGESLHPGEPRRVEVIVTPSIAREKSEPNWGLGVTIAVGAAATLAALAGWGVSYLRGRQTLGERIQNAAGISTDPTLRQAEAISSTLTGFNTGLQQSLPGWGK